MTLSDFTFWQNLAENKITVADWYKQFSRKGTHNKQWFFFQLCDVVALAFIYKEILPHPATYQLWKWKT